MEGEGVQECPRGVRRTQRGEAVRYTARVVCLREGVKALGEFASPADASQVLRGLHAPPPQRLLHANRSDYVWWAPCAGPTLHAGPTRAGPRGEKQAGQACFTAV